jgi:hypothetical protein
MHPYRPVLEPPPPRKRGRRWPPSWTPLFVVTTWPLALVMFCSMVRGFVDPKLIPSTVVYLAGGYALTVLVMCAIDLLRSN